MTKKISMTQWEALKKLKLEGPASAARLGVSTKTLESLEKIGYVAGRDPCVPQNLPPLRRKIWDLTAEARRRIS
jgi:diketogulonate reductase-like aldo/keto reductase